jgi:hypothetical protein
MTVTAEPDDARKELFGLRDHFAFGIVAAQAEYGKILHQSGERVGNKSS